MTEREKVELRNRVFFSGGFPRFYWIPRFRFFRHRVSIFWLGEELIVTWE